MPDHSVARSRDEKLNNMVDLYSTPLLRMCYVLLKDASLAEDALQDTFIKAYKSLGTFQPKDDTSEKSWLMKIAVNTCRDYRRSAWLRKVDRRYSVEEIIDSQNLSNEQESLLEDVLELPQKYREVLILHYYQDMDIEQICLIINERSATVYKRIQRARQMLRVQLERGDLDE